MENSNGVFLEETAMLLVSVGVAEQGSAKNSWLIMTKQRYAFLIFIII